jgi:putative membrane protein
MFLAYVKAFHIIAIIAWMAGLLYLPRLFVYHATSKVGSEQSETFKVMERRLLRAILNPAMGAAWIFGLLMVAHLEAWTEPWMLVKFGLVLGMQLVHGNLSRWRRDFAADAYGHD